MHFQRNLKKNKSSPFTSLQSLGHMWFSETSVRMQYMYCKNDAKHILSNFVSTIHSVRNTYKYKLFIKYNNTQFCLIFDGCSTINWYLKLINGQCGPINWRCDCIFAMLMLKNWSHFMKSCSILTHFWVISQTIHTPGRTQSCCSRQKWEIVHISCSRQPPVNSL